MTEAALPPAPFDIDEVLSPSWLSGELDLWFRGVVAGLVEVVEVIESIARKVRFTIEYEDRAGHDQLPTAPCLKGYFHPDAQQHSRTGIHEAHFYQRLASTVPLRVPTPRYAGIEPDRHGLVLMDDVVAAGSVFYNQLDFYDVDTARQSLEELARLHAAYWDAPFAAEEWLASKILFFPSFISDEIMDDLLRGPRVQRLPRRDPASGAQPPCPKWRSSTGRTGVRRRWISS